MNYIKIILKDKLFYIVLFVVVIVSTAMKHSSQVNGDLIAAYYEQRDSIPVAQEIQEVGLITWTLPDSLAKFALMLQGVPYKYGGKGPSVFDCSGFTCYVFKNFNIQLPASSALQSSFGKPVATDELIKGDLLLFRSFTTGVNDVGHVGIVISNEAGKVSFIHSSTTRGVVIDSLSHSHYKARFMGARRVLADSVVK